MVWNAPATAVTGDLIPASFWNTNGRDNLSHLRAQTGGADAAANTVLAGTGAGVSSWLTRATGNTANSIAQRDANGDLSARYHIGAEDTETVGPNTLIGRNNSADGIHRRFPLNLVTGVGSAITLAAGADRTKLDGIEAQSTRNPSYDSGWVQAPATANMTVVHNLGVPGVTQVFEFPSATAPTTNADLEDHPIASVTINAVTFLANNAWWYRVLVVTP